jgi:hypothetical protein
MSAIQKRNQRYTVGSNNGIKNEKTIVVLAQFDQAQAVGDVIKKSSFDGPVVRLKDIATISDGNVEEKSIVRVNAVMTQANSLQPKMPFLATRIPPIPTIPITIQSCRYWSQFRVDYAHI